MRSQKGYYSPVEYKAKLRKHPYSLLCALIVCVKERECLSFVHRVTVIVAEF